MNYKKLGNTDLVVSTICLGTMTWGEQNTIKEGFEQMDYALDQDINFFDAAEMYPSPCRKETYGETEKIIGHWFSERKNRDKIIKYMKTKGIETRNGFYSPNRLSLYKGCVTSNNLKHSEKLSKNIICLPFFTSLKEREMKYIAKTLLDLKR